MELVNDAQKFYTSIGRDVDLNDDHWVQVGEENGDDIWQAHISSPEALALRVFFSDFALETGSSVKVYGLNTSTDNPVAEYAETGMGDEGQFWSLIVPGDTIVIEHRVPAVLNIKPEDFAFNVVRISHTFRDDQGDVYGVSFYISQPRNHGICNFRNSVCSFSAQTAEVQSASLGVARYTVTSSQGTGSQCTGSLINSQSSNKTLYFLTAWHCIDDVVVNPEATGNPRINAEFEFNADRSCLSSSSGKGSGALFVAGHRRGDYALIRIEGDLAGTGRFARLGWDTTIHNPQREFFVIHHAEGEDQLYAEGRIEDLTYLNSINYDESANFRSLCSGGGCSHYDIRVTLGGLAGGASGSSMIVNGGINGVYTHGDSTDCHGHISLFNQIYQDGRVRGALTYGNDYFTNTGAARNFDDSARPSYSYATPPPPSPPSPPPGDGGGGDGGGNSGGGGGNSGGGGGNSGGGGGGGGTLDYAVLLLLVLINLVALGLRLRQVK